MREIEITAKGVFDAIGKVAKTLLVSALVAYGLCMIAVLGWATIFGVSWTLHKVGVTLVGIAVALAALAILALAINGAIKLYEKNPTLLKFGGVKLAKAKVRRK